MKSLVLVAASFLVMCGPPKEQPNVVEPSWKAAINGSAAGIEVVPQGALAITSYYAERTDPLDPTIVTPARYSLTISITDKPNICQELTYRNDTPNQSVLSFSLYRRDGQPIPDGTHAISFWSDPEPETGVRATALLSSNGPECKARPDNDAQFAKSGTVTLTSLTKTEVVGTFELTFASGTVTGSFTAPTCRSFIIAEIEASFTCLP